MHVQLQMRMLSQTKLCQLLCYASKLAFIVLPAAPAAASAASASAATNAAAAAATVAAGNFEEAAATASSNFSGKSTLTNVRRRKLLHVFNAAANGV